MTLFNKLHPSIHIKTCNYNLAFCVLENRPVECGLLLWTYFLREVILLTYFIADFIASTRLYSALRKSDK